MSPRATSLARVLDESMRERLRALGWLTEEGIRPVPEAALGRIQAGPDPAGSLERLLSVIEAADASDLSEPMLGRLAALVGGSRALARELVANPGWLDDLVPENQVRAVKQVRTFIARRFLSIAALDLGGELELSEVVKAVTLVADEAAAQLVPESAPFAVIAMGKWGGEELNYSSDIDVMFVGEPATDAEPARRAAAKAAAAFIKHLSESTGGGVGFKVDADLRPEGRSGALVRTVESFRSYYERWAEPWERQALLKARPVAGSPRLGEEFMAMAEPFIWPDRLPAEAVRSIRHNKQRIEQQADPEEVKRGVGGIRDIEFAVQLLQLVHGRADPGLRVRSTLEALDVLAAHGYVRGEDGVELAGSYRFLRTLEHRLQLWDLLPNYQVPTSPDDRERVARTMGYRLASEFDEQLRHHRATVRTIHERLFYRPLLETFAVAPAVSMNQEGVSRQLTALGFGDVTAAGRAFQEMTRGLTRRSKLMQQLLPLMLDWLSDTPNPALGLEQLRLLWATVPDYSGLVGLLGENPLAAERLCRLLGSSRLLGRYLDRIPEFLPRLGDDRLLEDTLGRPDLERSARERVRLRTNHEDRVATLRRFSRRRLLRTAAADLLGSIDTDAVEDALSATADATVAAALEVAALRLAETHPHLPAVPLAVIALGRWGGGELGYGSDLDLLYVADVPPENDHDAGREWSLKAAALTSSAVGEPGRDDVAFVVDPDLRPEGRQGALVRSVGSYLSYYEKWAEPWELLALTRARTAAGDAEVGQRFLDAIEPSVWRSPLPRTAVAEIRRIKARVESERIRPGEDPDFHLKLGEGGLSDVEFTVQLLQLRHGGREPSLRTPNTSTAIHRLVEGGHLTTAEGMVLTDAYRFCTRARNRLMLQTGRAGDSLPVDFDEGTRLALALGYESRAEMREDYRRVTRKARRVVMQRFYGSGSSTSLTHP